MTDTLILFAATDSLLTRLAVAAVASVVGVMLILVGRVNIQTRTAEETGRRRMVNRALGRSNTYEGDKAVMMGYVRIVIGVCAIIFGIVFIFVGPFLANVGKSSGPAAANALGQVSQVPASRQPWQPNNSPAGLHRPTVAALTAACDPWQPGSWRFGRQSIG